MFIKYRFLSFPKLFAAFMSDPQTKMQACRRLAFGLFLGCAGQWQAKHQESSLLLACPGLSEMLACYLACYDRLNSRPNYRRLVFGLSFFSTAAIQIKLTGQNDLLVYVIWKNDTFQSKGEKIFVCSIFSFWKVIANNFKPYPAR